MFRSALLSLSILFAAPALAEETVCHPLKDFVVQAKMMGIPDDKIRVQDDMSWVKLFFERLGLWPIPEDSDAEALFLVYGRNGVFLALIEPGNCIKHQKAIDYVQYEAAAKVADNAGI